MPPPRLQLYRRVVCAALLSGGAGVLGYCGHRYWQKIQVYPPETRLLLRTALRAAHAERVGDAERHFHSALNSCIQSTGESSHPTQGILLRMAEFYVENERPDRAALIYESLLASRLAREWEEPARMTHRIKKMLADTYLETDRLDEAGEMYREVLASVQIDGKASKDPSTLGPIYEGMGDVHFKRSELDRAMEAYRTAARYCESGGGRRTVQHLTLVNNIASCLFAQQTSSSLAEANKVAKQGLALADRMESGPDVAALTANLCTIIEHSK